MLHVGLDLSRTRLDVHAMDEAGTSIAVTTAAPDAGGLASLVMRLEEFGQPVTAVIESMNGARFVHDTLEEHGWDVLVADAQKVKGLAPLACTTDRIDARGLAVLSERDLVPAIWLPDPCAGRARACPLAAAPRPASLEPQAARARRPAHPRQALPRENSHAHANV